MLDLRVGVACGVRTVHCGGWQSLGPGEGDSGKWAKEEGGHKVGSSKRGGCDGGVGRNIPRVDEGRGVERALGCVQEKGREREETVIRGRRRREC